MAISYPQNLPDTNHFRFVDMRAINATAVSKSPFSFKESRYSWGGEMWQADITLKPMRRSDAEQWLAFFVSMRGQFGTFLLGDPLGCTTRGTATSATVTGSAGDRSVTVSMTGTLLSGDYLQLGTGSDSALHKVVKSRDGSGTLEIWPALRVDRTAVSATLTSAKGVFRLAANEFSWSANELAVYGITFAAEGRLFRQALGAA